MDFYDISALQLCIRARCIIVAPNDRLEWIKYCWALKTLGFDKSFFVASSYPNSNASKVWDNERRFSMTEQAAKGIIVALAKAAGVDVGQFRLRKANAATTTKAARVLPQAETDKAKQPPLYIAEDDIAAMEAERDKTALYNFLCSVFPPSDVAEAFRRYKVGATRRIFQFAAAPNMASAFPYLNAAGQCVDVKLMAYDKNGHRDKGQYSLSWELSRRKQSDRRGQWPLFGEHLLTTAPAAPVGIVESEKTALIASIVAPGVLWMATASLTNLNSTRLSAVKDRQVYLFPDADGVEQWRQRAATLAEDGFKIFLCSEYITANAESTKDDIGDIILRYYQSQLSDEKL